MTLILALILGIVTFLLLIKKEAAAGPYTPPETSVSPPTYTPKMPTPEGWKPYKEYYAPFSISRNQEYYIWATRTASNIAYVKVTHIVTSAGGDDEWKFDLGVPREVYRHTFDHLTSQPALSVIQAEQLGALHCMFGFKE